ncbi:hypothetical protein FOU89_16750 [Salmonella enterica]|nr:hypothetical protein [Salmonella enterica]
MNTNLYENANSETTKPLNKRRILPVFFIVALYAASTSAVMSVLPFYIREMGGSPLIIGVIIATEAFSQAPPSVNAACQTLPGRGLGENDRLD